MFFIKLQAKNIIEFTADDMVEFVEKLYVPFPMNPPFQFIETMKKKRVEMNKNLLKMSNEEKN